MLELGCCKEDLAVVGALLAEVSPELARGRGATMEQQWCYQGAKVLLPTS